MAQTEISFSQVNDDFIKNNGLIIHDFSAKIKQNNPLKKGLHFTKNTGKILLGWVGAGISYAMTDNWGLDLGYRYMDNGDTTCKLPGTDGEKLKMESKSHNVSLGIRYTF